MLLSLEQGHSFGKCRFLLLFALHDHIALMAEDTITLVSTFSFTITSPGRYGQNWRNTTYRAG